MVTKKPIILLGAIITACSGLALTMNPYYSQYTDTNQETSSTDAGTIRIKSNNDSNSVIINGMKPGQSSEFILTMENTGTLPIRKLDLNLTSTGGLVNQPKPIKTWEVINPKTGAKESVTGKADKPLLLTLEYCDTNWINSNNNYTCNGTLYPILNNVSSESYGPTNTSFSTIDLKNYLKPTQIGYLKLKTTLPSDAGVEYAGENAKISLRTTATQRSGYIKGVN